MTPEEPSGFNTRLWRRFIQIARPYWQSEERWRSRGLLALLMLLLLGQTAFNVWFNHETGEFTSALAARDADRFWASIRRYTFILMAAVPIYALYYYVRDTLGLRWRRWLTRHFLARYFDQRAYYRLNAVVGIDNPDQRIAEDINAFTQQSLYFSMIALGSVIQLIAFASVLWAISQGLVYFLIGYAIFSTGFTAKVFGKRLIGLNYRQLQREADFRFSLVRVREHAEPIAFHSGEEREMSALARIFDTLYANYQQVLRWQFKLNLFQYTHSFLTIVLPSVIIANQVLAGDLEVGQAIQAAGAFAAILSALTVIVEHFESLSRFSAGVDRLHAFSATLADPAQAPAPAEPPGTSEPSLEPTARIHTVPGFELGVTQLTVLTPNREHLLLRNLTLSVHPGRGLLIVGAERGRQKLAAARGGGTLDHRFGRSHAPRRSRHAFSAAEPLSATGRPALPAALPPDRSRDLRRRAAAMAGTREPAHPGRALWRAGAPRSTGPRCCRWANSSAWPSRAPCWPSPATCCWTRPRARSTRPTRRCCTGS